ILAVAFCTVNEKIRLTLQALGVKSKLRFPTYATFWYHFSRRGAHVRAVLCHGLATARFRETYK
ncbi:MAG: hypothetical protein IKV48_07620, partial [Eggerthellaceae bacterium]|nr:hypothetical protein [Eggerthellaceae bacterium]